MIKYIKILGNSSRDLIPMQKRWLYRYCVLSIALYSFQLWYYNKIPLVYPLKELRKIQRRDASYTSPTLGIKAIAGLIPIHLYLQKLSGRSQLRVHSLSSNHIIKLLSEMRSSNDNKPHQLLLKNHMPRQWTIIKDPIVDIDNRFNKVFTSFSSFHCEFSPRNRLIDIFLNHFLFHLLNRKSNDNIKSHLCKLDSIIFQVSLILHSVVVVSDASIKNHVATFISYIHSYNSSVIKTIHHAVNISSTEAELFAIRCGINQAIHLPNINYIFVITNSIYAANRIFDSLLHPYQIHLAAIFCKLREFFQKNNNNSIEFWDYPSKCKWSLHDTVDKETKKIQPHPILPYRSSWNFSKKWGYNDILNKWKMSFQVLDNKGQNFLKLLDEDLKPIELLISKSGLWLKYFGHSNSLCARATRAIINHAPIGECHLRFFSWEEFKCPCNLYPIESRHQILHECKRYNNY